MGLAAREFKGASAAGNTNQLAARHIDEAHRLFHPAIALIRSSPLLLDQSNPLIFA